MSEMGASENCPYEGEREVRSLYLAGRLPEAEAQAFERHYFNCELCAEALEVGTKLRAGYGKRPVAVPAAASASVPPARRWLPLAAAAVLALVAFGVWQLADRSPAPSVLRGGDAPRDVRIEGAENGALRVQWTAVAGAARYAVRLHSPDGTELWKMETAEPHAEVPRARFSAAPGKSLLVEVEALDARGRALGTSEPAKLP